MERQVAVLIPGVQVLHAIFVEVWVDVGEELPSVDFVLEAEEHQYAEIDEAAPEQETSEGLLQGRGLVEGLLYAFECRFNQKNDGCSDQALFVVARRVISVLICEVYAKTIEQNE